MKNIKQKLRDLCWYKICYADLLKNKDKDKYANIMADDILELFEQQKQEMVEDVEKYAGKVFGFEIIILKDKYDKRYIAGFGDGKKYLKGEVFKLLVPNKT